MEAYTPTMHIVRLITKLFTGVVVLVCAGILSVVTWGSLSQLRQWNRAKIIHNTQELASVPENTNILFQGTVYTGSPALFGLALYDKRLLACSQSLFNKGKSCTWTSYKQGKPPLRINLSEKPVVVIAEGAGLTKTTRKVDIPLDPQDAAIHDNNPSISSTASGAALFGFEPGATVVVFGRTQSEYIVANSICGAQSFADCKPEYSLMALVFGLLALGAFVSAFAICIDGVKVFKRGTASTT